MSRTSASLLLRLRNNEDEAAWTRFVQLYTPLILHSGCRYGLSRDDAADMTQEVLRVLLKRMPSFKYDPSRRFRSWLATITRNKSLELLRRNRVRKTVPELQEQMTVVPSNVDWFETREYDKFLFRRALSIMKSEFSELQWQACYRVVVEGQKPAVVAEQLGMTINSVYLAKSRVLQRVRKELAGFWE